MCKCSCGEEEAESSLPPKLSEEAVAKANELALKLLFPEGVPDEEEGAEE